jgi:hypothetical protein
VDLILIGVIDTGSGESLSIPDIGFSRVVDLKNRENEPLDLNQLQNRDIRNKEGYVVEFDNGDRIKVKFPWYKEIHDFLDKALCYEKLSYVYKKRLANALSIKQKPITNFDIWEVCKEGKDIDTVFKYIPDAYYQVGFLIWLEERRKSFLCQFKNLQKENSTYSSDQIWELIKPSKIEVFNVIEKMNQTYYETTIYNMYERIKK